MGAKRATAKQIEKFRQDMEYLIRVKKYSNGDIAARIGVNAANLSSLRSGAKNPGVQTIKKFYMEFGNETGKAKYEDGDDPSKVEEAQVANMSRNYRDELVDILKDNDVFLKEEMRTINRTHLYNAQAERKKAGAFQKIANTNESLVKQQNAVNKGILVLIKTNSKLADKATRASK